MRREWWWVALVTMLAACAGGGGGSAVEVDLAGPLPDKVVSIQDHLVLTGVLKDGATRTAKVLSLSAPAVTTTDGQYRFAFEKIADLPDQGAALQIELRYPIDSTNSVIVGLLVANDIKQTMKSAVKATDATLDTAFDDDGDGVENLDEVLRGLNPQQADSDGDGVPDGRDLFPAVSSEWSDMDGDGIGDNVDGDMDGDGLSNEEEVRRGTNPRLADSDGDGILDGDDHCPLQANPENVCTEDTDGDGLSNSYEITLGTDPFRADSDGDGVGDGVEVAQGSNPLRADTDGDGVGDANDNCVAVVNPSQADLDHDGWGDACDGDRDGDGVDNDADNCPDTWSLSQDDTDADGVGDACDADIDGDGIANALDNCPFVANPEQLRTDADGDGVPVECDLDDHDPRVHAAQSAIFVDGTYGSDTNRGTRLAPLATLAAAINRASASGLDVYVAAGNYSTADVVVPSHIGLYGGFLKSMVVVDRFSQRDVRSVADGYRTTLSRDDASVTLSLAQTMGTIVSGFSITNGGRVIDPAVGTRSIVIVGGNPIIEQNTIVGNATSSFATAVAISADATATIVRNRIDGGGMTGAGTETVGVRSDGSQPTLTNNIIIAGRGRFVSGVDIVAGAPVLVHNTIDARSGDARHGTAEGVSFSDAAPRLINNFIFTGTAPDQYPLVCWGTGPDATASFQRNFLAVIGSDASLPLVRDCDGVNSGMGSNMVSQFSELFDVDYRPVSWGVDAAVVTSDHQVTDDFYGAERPRGAGYDIGAVER